MNQLLRHFLIVVIVFASFQAAYGQFDTLSVVLKPRIGIGTGTMAYFGEIQKNQSGFSSTVNRLGGNLMVNAPLNKAFNVEFVGTYGKVSANERTLARNFNFQSRIRMASLSFQYNFYPLFSPTRSFFNPYLGIGITSFEFLSKTDLRDATGQLYYYWNDGSIMNMAQNDPNAEDAMPLVRDYTYETDLRSQNFDSLGRYREQSFAIPISFGAEFHLTPRVDFRIGTTLNYTFTDLIDNISPAGEGVRKGDDRNDFILYSNIGLSYDLEFFVQEEPYDALDSGEDLLAYEQVDWDQDGVIDAIDDCFQTPIEALVDARGCPIDTDKDGVDDYFDEEVTPLGNHVNRYGVTISEEEFMRWREMMMDSTGLAFSFEEVYSVKDFTGIRVPKVAKAKDPENKKYVVIIGKEHKSISANQLHEFLGYTEFETVMKGDTVYYVLGRYEFIEDAVAAKSSLENEGVEIKEIAKSNFNETDFRPINNRVVEKIEKINMTSGKPLPEFNSDRPSYRVQIGSYRKPIDVEKVFPGIEDITYAKGQDGLIRYYAGVFDSYKEAKQLSEKLAKKGNTQNFVVAYQNRERITLKEAKVLLLPKNYNEKAEILSFVEPRDTSKAEQSGLSKIPPSEVKYQVLLGSFNGNVPIEIIEKYLSIGGIRPLKEKDGVTKYYSRKVSSLSEAENLVENYTGYDLTESTIVILYKGEYYTIAEFEKKKR
ncbi:MAG: SPOR domain-containing protein [Crocinitomicaceae bacterium]